MGHTPQSRQNVWSLYGRASHQSCAPPIRAPARERATSAEDGRKGEDTDVDTHEEGDGDEEFRRHSM